MWHHLEGFAALSQGHGNISMVKSSSYIGGFQFGQPIEVAIQNVVVIVKSTIVSNLDVTSKLGFKLAIVHRLQR